MVKIEQLSVEGKPRVSLRFKIDPILMTDKGPTHQPVFGRIFEDGRVEMTNHKGAYMPLDWPRCLAMSQGSIRRNFALYLMARGADIIRKGKVLPC